MVLCQMIRILPRCDKRSEFVLIELKTLETEVNILIAEVNIFISDMSILTTEVNFLINKVKNFGN